MKKKILNVFKYLFFLGLGLFLVWWSLNAIPDEKWPVFKEALLTARYWVIVPVFFILSSSHLLRAIRWKILMGPLGYRPSLVNTFFAVMIGYLANLAVPRLGEVLKCTILSRYEKVPAEKLVGTIVAERAFDLISLLIIFVLALIFQYEVVFSYSRQLFAGLFASGSGNVSVTKVSVVLLIILAAIFLVRKALQRFAYTRFVIAVKRVLSGIWQGLISIKGLKQKGPFILCSAGIWLLYIGGTWLGFYATSGTAHLGLPPAISSLAFASVGMIATPGGIGAYATFMAAILERNGVPFEIGLANGNLQWLAQFIIVLLVGFICLGLLPVYNKKKIHHEKARNYSVENL
ncbi:flippase-like domain-containing protein [Segetibacter sp. 3557_3]|uniref:lysylphosphatidylglycerol synthase transmembrane domain-containing protein n=1 Tax=Segetibacter sp. 3557_3 TaxID=2547429 RepID=UPI001058B732|nr:lysylphosphatidylglycerol synthase transmembrane domain-containing protein [Segetibacter sp. 3557_3]TDH28856.1 flippase-like domain-containing protein [Segetibacter sp. 3557_3]